MEAVLVLAEIWTSQALDALTTVARRLDLPEERRAAAVWAMSPGGATRSEHVLEFVADRNDLVAMHAIVAAGRALRTEELRAIGNRLGGEPREADAAAYLLARQGVPGARALLEVAKHDHGDARVWATFGPGRCSHETVASATDDQHLPSDILDLLEPMWRGNEGWLEQGDAAIMLSFIDRQQLPPIVE